MVISGLIWLRSYHSQYILNQKIQIIESKYDLFNTILEARRYEKNYFLTFDRKNINQTLTYVNTAEDILNNILSKYAKYTLAKNLDERLIELKEYKDSLVKLLKMQEDGHLMIPQDFTQLIQKQGRIITSELEEIVKKESQFTRDLIGKSRMIHLIALAPVFFLSVLVALFLIFNVDRPLKTIGSAIIKISKGDFQNIPEIHTGDEFESLVTSLNTMFKELNKRNKELVQAQKLASLGRLTSGVAHELNNPLNNISTSVQILIEELEDDDLEYKKDLLIGAEKEVERSKEIVKSLLEFARERSHTLKQAYFKDLVNNAIKRVKSQVPENITLTVDVPDDIQGNFSVLGIERVLINLIVNAVQAMKNGGEVTVKACKQESNSGFCFQVIDTGEGIPTDIISKIFDPFFTTKEVGKGTGLLAARKPGETLDVLGPLGSSFVLPPSARKVFIVAGGMGVAPMVFLAQHLVASGLKPFDCEVFLGGRTCEDLLCMDEFAALNLPVHTTTDDGSAGDQCLVTHPVDIALADRRPDVVFACGPLQMLDCVIGIAAAHGVICQVSIETAMACGLGAKVYILDMNLDRLRYLSDVMPANCFGLFSSPAPLRELIQRADVVVGAVLIPGTKAPKLITREMLKTMKPGSVLVDVAIDQGGCFETSKATTHGDPIYVVDGVVHYCVANMPGAVPRTSTMALTNATLPYALQLAAKGYKIAVRQNPDLAKGVNIINGKVTYQGVADAFGLEYTPLDAVL